MLKRLIALPHVERVRAFVQGQGWLLLGIAGVSGLVLLFLRLADEVVDGETEAFDRAILLLFRDPNNIDKVLGHRGFRRWCAISPRSAAFRSWA